MKKFFTLNMILLALVCTYKSNAQCSVNQPTITLNSTSVNQNGNCVVNFDITYNLPNSNGGNKFQNIFIWTSAAYAALPANFYGSQNNSAPSATAVNNANTLVTITIDRDLTTTQCYSRNGSGTCSGTQPASLQQGLTVIKTMNGNTLTYAIKNVSVILPGACNIVTSLVTDVWSSQSSSNNSVSCITTGYAFSLNEHNLSGFKDCNNPRMIHFGVYTNSASVPVKYTYRIYLDNGNASYDPGDVDVTDASSLTDTITVTTTGAGGIVSRAVDFIGNGTAGESGDYWIVLTPVGGTYSISALLTNSCFTLPVHLLNFFGNMDKNNKVTLNWTIADNETASSFVVERSTNGRDFTTVAIVMASEKTGTENYTYYEMNNTGEKVLYRLQMVDKGHNAEYTRILVFQGKTLGKSSLRIIGNPVSDKLTFSYTSLTAETVNVKVFDAAGRLMMNQRVNSLEGNNLVSLSLNAAMKPGVYVVQVNSDDEIRSAKFLKQ